MKKQISFHNRNIEYTLRISKRARRLRLTIYGDGAFVVTVPRNMSEHSAEQFIIKKSQWIIDKLDYIEKFPQPKLVRHNNKRDFFKYKTEAYALAKIRVEYFNDFYNFKVNKITIRNQSTRWGSCSRKGNLNFNYKIALLPPRLADYLIVHELCHLGEFNHSQKFWNLVAKTFPDWLSLRNSLKVIKL